MSLRQRKGRPSARDLLIGAMTARGGQGADVRAVESSSWASATFAGARHRLEIRLPGRAAAAAFEDGLTEAEFMLRGHLLADITISGRHPDGERTVLCVDALTIEEAGL